MYGVDLRDSLTYKWDLSRNELVHAHLENLWRQFASGLDPRLVNRYPCLDAAVQHVAEFLGVEVDSLVLSAGSEDAIKMLSMICEPKFGAVLLQAPNFHAYEKYSKIAGRSVDRVWSLDDDSRFEVRLAAAVASSPQQKMIIVTNPAGVDGGYLNLERVRGICQLAKEGGHTLVIDEAYISFSGLDHLGLVREYDNLVILRSLSKSFGVAGLRLGLVISDSRRAEKFRDWGGAQAISGIALSFLLHCLQRENARIIEDVQLSTAHVRDWFAEELRSDFPESHVPVSKGNFVAINLSRGDEAQRLFDFLRSRGILVRRFQENRTLASWLRITIGERWLMEAVLSVIREFRGAVSAGP